MAEKAVSAGKGPGRRDCGEAGSAPGLSALPLTSRGFEIVSSGSLSRCTVHLASAQQPRIEVA